MQSRLEEEEEAKVALTSRIQRLTKLILVSSKNSIPGCLSDVPSHQRNKSSFDDVSCLYKLSSTYAWTFTSLVLLIAITNVKNLKIQCLKDPSRHSHLRLPCSAHETFYC